MPYKIDKVEALPQGIRASTTEYLDIVNEVDDKGDGFYKITMEGKKPTTILAQLSKAVKSMNTDDISVHKIKGEVYLQNKTVNGKKK
jgi:hypothetical protein